MGKKLFMCCRCCANARGITIVRVLQKAFSHALDAYERPELAAKRKRRRLRAKVT